MVLNPRRSALRLNISGRYNSCTARPMKSKIYDEFYCSDFKPARIREHASTSKVEVWEHDGLRGEGFLVNQFRKHNSVRVSADTTRKIMG